MPDPVPRVALRGDSRSELHPKPQLRADRSEIRPPRPVRRVPPEGHGFRNLTLYSSAEFREVPDSQEITSRTPSIPAPNVFVSWIQESDAYGVRLSPESS